MRVVLSNAAMRWGGVHPLTLALARGLRERGHEAAVFHRPGSAVAPLLDEAGIAAEAVIEEPELSPTIVWRAARAFRRHRPDVVLTLTEADARIIAPVARVLGIPVVVHRASDRPLGRRPHVRLVYGTLAAHHVTASDAARDALLRSASWLAPEAVTTIRGGIDRAPFDAAPTADLGLPEGALAIGFVGRLEERKGVLDLARAWAPVAAALPEAHLVIAGSGPAEGDARAALTGEPRVVWLGYRGDVPSVMRALDVVALPSHREGHARTLAEAMAAGRAVVACRASGVPEMIDDGTDGVLVPARNSTALAAALITLGRDAAARARLGAAARARCARDLALPAILDQWESVLTAVASAPDPEAWR